MERIPAIPRTAAPVVLLAALFSIAGSALAADAPSPDLALSFRPRQADVEYEIPEKSDYSKCKVNVERKGKASGWVVIGPNGQTLRRFIDTNGDNVVDQWRYFQHGLEVYRDVDSNFDNKIDQCRWLNAGGSRWGVDNDQDGKIDAWKIISAEEVSREAVRAMAANDASILTPLLMTAEDLRTLGVSSQLQKTILDSVSSPSTKLRAALSKATNISSKTKWVRFNAAQPGIIPADEGKATSDLMVYENAMAIIETDSKPGLIQIGELVQVGKAWKLTQIPQPVGDNVQVAAGGLLMQPQIAGAASSGTSSGGVSPELQKLLADLQKLDRTAPQPSEGPKAFADYNARRAVLLQKLVDASKDAKEREQWRRQLIDGIAAAVQTGAYPDGLKQLQALETQIAREDRKSDLLPYVTFRRLLAEYTVRLQNATTKDRAEIQSWWLKQLESFATTWPTAEDSPEAMVQLAIALEFSGNLKDARKWYQKASSAESESIAKERAGGALRRIDLVGNTLTLSGNSLTGGKVDLANYRGKVVLVIFWSTWCKPCTEDLPQIKELYRKYQPAGFEIVGVNLDVAADAAKTYVTQYGNSWPHIFEEGGLDSAPARKFGIISLPTMFLVDGTGKVVSRSVSVEILKKDLPTLLKRN